MRSWYVVQTVHGREKTACIHLEGTGYETYLPMTWKDRRRRKRDPRKIPLFPTYLFVRLAGGRDDFHPVVKTPGVRRMVKFSVGLDGVLYPTAVSDSLIQAYRALEDEDGLHSSHQTDYRPGDRVRVRSGAARLLEAHIGEIRRAKTGEERARILGHHLGSMSGAWIALNNLESA